jgi:hypothetical protein
MALRILSILLATSSSTRQYFTQRALVVKLYLKGKNIEKLTLPYIGILFFDEVDP